MLSITFHLHVLTGHFYVYIFSGAANWARVRNAVSGHGPVDFDEEGRKVLSQRLNLGEDAVRGQSRHDDYNAIYRSKKGGGIIYVGNDRLAQNAETMRKLGITRIVNCTQGKFESKISTLNFTHLTLFYRPLKATELPPGPIGYLHLLQFPNMLLGR